MRAIDPAGRLEARRRRRRRGRGGGRGDGLHRPAPLPPLRDSPQELSLRLTDRDTSLPSRCLQSPGRDRPSGLSLVASGRWTRPPSPTSSRRASGSRPTSATALNRYPALDELVGAETWVKHENHQPVGASRCAAASTSSRSSPRTTARRGVDHRLDRQPRPVDRVRVDGLRRARDHLRPRGREPGEGRLDPRPRRRDRRPRPRLRRRPRALRGARRGARLPLHPLGQRAAPDRRRRHAHARDARAAAGARRPDRPDRRRERRGRRLHRGAASCAPSCR